VLPGNGLYSTAIISFDGVCIPGPMLWKFLTFELDTERRELRDGGVPVAVSPKAFDVLSYLVEHRDRMIPKPELLDAFWTSEVSEAALQKTISQIRKALGGNRGGAFAIKTYHGRGFRFVAVVEGSGSCPEPEPEHDRVGDGDVTHRPLFTVAEQRLAAVLCVRLADGVRGNPDGPNERNGEAQFLATAREVVDRHRGVLLNMLVDGFTAAFGLDIPFEDGTRRAVYCAAALMADIPGPRGGGMPLVAGIDTGRADARAEEDSARWVLPNEIERTAVDLTAGGASGDILLGASAWAQLGGEADVEETAAGFRLVSLGPMRAGIPARPQKRPTRFVGRAAEQAFLASHLAALRAGTGQALTLTGPPGIGKTRLVSEFLDTLDPTGFRVARLQCLPSLTDTPVAPIRDLCRLLFSNLPTGVGIEGVDLDEVDVALLRDLLDDAVTDAPPLQAIPDHTRRQRSRALVDRLMRSVCTEYPHILVFEDIHWIDATSWEYLEELVRSVDRKRMMVLMTTRHLQGPESGDPAGSALQLSPLGHQESMDLLRDIYGGERLDAVASKILVRRAAGNPFFIEELALAAQTGGDPATDLPDTVQAVTAIRIGSLGEDLRSLVFLVAVIGPPAPIELIAALLGLPTADVEERMLRLFRMGFVQAGPDGYTFRHMLINDTAYVMVAPADRKRLHAQIARHLETAGTAGIQRPERLAWHFQEAGEPVRAIPYWVAASRAALHRSARLEAIAFARKGLALIDTKAPDSAANELDLQLCLAPALTALRGFGADAVGEAYGRAQQLNAVIGTPKTAVRVQVGLWIHTWVRGRLTQSLDHAGRLLDLAERAPGPALSLQAHAGKGQVLLHTGEFHDALHHLENGLRAYGGQQPATVPAQNAAVSCSAYAAWVCSALAREEDARRYLTQSQRLSALYANPYAEAIHYALGTGPLMFLGDADSCLTYADRAISVSRQHDFAFWLGTALVLRGWALGRHGRAAAARAAMDEGIAVFEATGAGVQLANWYGLKAETLLISGDVQGGLDAANHALACAESTGDIFFTPRIHATLARLHDALGKPELAALHRHKAAELAGRMGMPAKVYLS